MFFKQLFDEKLAQYSYLIGCQQTGEAVVVDPMRYIQPYFDLANKEDLHITAAIDTHIHADYVSGLREFAERNILVYASAEGGADWQYEWLLTGNYDYHLLRDKDTFNIGNILFKVLFTPGHTPEHVCYLITDAGGGADEPMGILTGDFVFVGDLGRPDLLETAAGQAGIMKESAKDLYQSLKKFKRLPEFYRVWPGHGAGSACGKHLGSVPESTVGYELRFNAAIQRSGSETEFVKYILLDQPEPPLYFSRMKIVNKKGPDVLRKLPVPAKIGSDEISGLAGNLDIALIDTRGKGEFMKGHIPASILSPYDNQFNTVAGSFIREETPIYLFIEEDNLQQAVRDLVNVGLDNIKGYFTRTDYLDYTSNGGKVDKIEHINFEGNDERMKDQAFEILDVRKAEEFAQGYIPEARNIPHTRLLEKLHELPKNKKIFVHCQSGARASVSSALLKRYGHNVTFVDGQFSSWKKAGHKILTPNIR